MNHKNSISTMNREFHAIGHDLNRLSHDARGLLAATADVAGGEVAKARERLAHVLDHGRDSYGHIRDRAIARTRAAGQVMHRHPYQTLGIGVGIAALLGYLMVRRWLVK